MNYEITHTDTIDAESEEKARTAYVQNWEDGFYSANDLDIEEKE